MRQLLTLLLSFGVLVLGPGSARLSAQPLAAPGSTNVAENIANRRVELAQQQLSRIAGLVADGALPRVRMQEAQMDLDDARDEAILDRTLYAGYAGSDSSQNSADIVAAAQRMVDREQTRVARAREIIAVGVAAESTLQPLEQEMTLRETSLDMAKLHARLLEEAAAQERIPKIVVAPAPAVEDIESFAQGSEHYEGDGTFDESRQLAPIEVAFESRFEHPLPISADGETEVHRELGFDHRGRVDVAVNPDQPEGIWLREYLKLHRIPYYAFTHAIPGKATAAHIHIGPGSTRLTSVRRNRRLGSRSRIAD